MSMDLGSCAVRETIVVTSRASVYELIVLRGDEGDVLVRGAAISQSSAGRCSSVQAQTTVRSTHRQSISVFACSSFVGIGSSPPQRVQSRSRRRLASPERTMLSTRRKDAPVHGDAPQD